MTPSRPRATGLRQKLTATMLGLLALAACDTGAADPDPKPQVQVDWQGAGPHAVGHVQLQAVDPKTGRNLAMTLWYPAQPSAAAAAALGTPLATFLPEGPTRTAFVALLDQAPPACVAKLSHSAEDAAPIAGTMPLVVYSHCHGCTRFSAVHTAVRLASHGIALLAVDHAGNTLMEAQAGVTAPLNSAILQVRAADLRFALDFALDPQQPKLPAALRNRFAGRKIGVCGHSFGAVTAGLVAQSDPRISAAWFVAAPIQNPLLPGVDAAQIAVPAGFLLAKEDNSITALGNAMIAQNFAKLPGPAWLVEVADAGHWSFSELAGLIPAFAPGCGAGTRQEDASPFTYLDNPLAREIAARSISAFFGEQLLGDASARATLLAPGSTAVVSTTSKAGP